MTSSIEVGSSDKRVYRTLTLENGLSVLLISDPETDKSAASLDMHIGHYHDPANVPGLAHFLEHMLFLGTERYPDENGYADFLAKNGGSSNAYTSTEDTNYHFSVAHAHLEEVLDRFSQFFVAPLFTPSATEREINAVDSEHNKNLQVDMWRTFQLMKSIADPAHPFSKFGTGNKKTLAEDPAAEGIDTRDALLAFHKRYSAHLMTLAVLGREDLDTLEGWVRDPARFSLIANRHDPAAPPTPCVSAGSPLTAIMTKEVRVVPVKDVRYVRLVFPLPPMHGHYKEKPTRLLGHFLGHESAGSILSHLKQKGWAMELMAGDSQSDDGFSTFEVTVETTEEGITKVNEIASVVFEYLAMLRRDLDEAAGLAAFDEVRTVSETDFRFKPKEGPMSYVSSLSVRMQKYPIEHCVSGPHLFRSYDHDLMRSILEMLVPSNAVLMLASKSFEADGSTPLREQWYQTQYGMTQIDDALLKTWAAPTIAPELHLPAANDFIATDFALLPPQEGQDETTPPTLALDTPVSKVWHKQDSTFGEPRLVFICKLVSPVAYTSPRAAVLTELFRLLVRDELNEYVYFAELAGLSYQLQESWCGINLQLGGYNDKLHILARKVAEKMKSFDPAANVARFDAIQEKLVRKYVNFSKEAPYQHVMSDIMVVTRDPRWSVDEKLASLRETPVTTAELAEFVPRLLARMKGEALVHGNATAAAARELVAALMTTLQPTSLFTSEIPQARHIELPLGASYQYTGVEANKDQPCGAICVYLQVGECTFENQALANLAAHVIREPAFDSLRTKQQLGYIVWTGVAQDAGVVGIRCIVQSDKFLTSKLDARIEGFFGTTMREKLDAMEAAELEEHKVAACKDLREKPKTLRAEAGRAWSEISRGTYVWNRRGALADAIEALDLDTLRAFYDEVVAPGGARRRKLSMRIEGHKAGKAETETGEEAAAVPKAEGAEEGDDATPPAELELECEEVLAPLSAFRQRMKLYPCESYAYGTP